MERVKAPEEVGGTAVGLSCVVGNEDRDEAGFHSHSPVVLDCDGGVGCQGDKRGVGCPGVCGGS